ncbi:sugar transporter STL1 [Aspergillus udagawae]|uniref:Sugar transporter STL1 n=1 Tax=Aspergillus udagawae TaxID=91492 RepID=A0A8H3S7P3_9EURO|nr:sugar transporter STL1 [Aspergillus udagawae]
MPPALAVRLTCQACTRRKVKCDKKSPCTNCLKHGISCVAVERPRWPRGRSGKQAISREQDLGNRVAKLEQMIQDLSHSTRVTGDISNRCGETTVHRSGQSPKSPSGTLQASEEWFLPQPSTIPRSADSRDDALDSGFAHNTTRQEQHIGDYGELPSEPVRRRRLVEIFLHQVDPILKILHRPSLCAYLLEGKPYLDYAPGDPVPAALASAVLYMASSTLAEGQCLALLGERKETVLTRYKDEAKAALARVDFLVTNHLTVLQALVLSLVAARTHDHSRRVWTMLSVALRIAQALSLHMTDPPFPVTPFEREMRRRVWHLIGWLDLEASLNRGSESMMRSAWIQTHSLTNINDDDFGFDTVDPLPAAQSGPTETTLLIMFAHGQCALRVLDLSHFAEPGITDIHMRQQTVDDFRRTTNELLAGCDPKNVAFHWFICQIQEQISAILQLIALRPLQRSPTFIPAELPAPQMLALAADILERRQRMFSDPRAHPWRWFNLFYFPWHALVVAMTEVCVCTDRWVIDRYWPTLERSYEALQKQAVGTQYDWLLASMGSLVSNARAARQKVIASGAPRDEAPNPHIYMDMASLEGSILSDPLPAVRDATLAAEELSQLQDQEATAWAQYEDFTGRFYEMDAIFGCGLTHP